MVPNGLGSSILASHLSPNASNLVTSALGSAYKPPNGPVVGSTDLRSSPSISSGPCQLTIFYNGSVCVYDNVSPDKAQAIMLLAGNGDSPKPTPLAAAQSPVVKVQPPVSRQPPNDSAVPTQQPLRLSGNDTSNPNQPPVARLTSNDSAVPTQQSLRLSGNDTTIPNQPLVARLTSNDSTVANQTTVPKLQSNDSDTNDQPPAPRFQVKDISGPNPSVGFSCSTALPSHSASAPVVASTSTTEVNAVKPIVTPMQIKYSETTKSTAAVGAGGLKLIPSAVPQARKASLARFLEKRKERVIGASPYVVSKNSSECSTVGPGSKIPANTASASPLPASS